MPPFGYSNLHNDTVFYQWQPDNAIEDIEENPVDGIPGHWSARHNELFSYKGIDYSEFSYPMDDEGFIDNTKVLILWSGSASSEDYDLDDQDIVNYTNGLYSYTYMKLVGLAEKAEEIDLRRYETAWENSERLRIQREEIEASERFHIDRISARAARLEADLHLQYRNPRRTETEDEETVTFRLYADLTAAQRAEREQEL